VAPTVSDPLPVQRNLVLGLLLVLAAASWVWLLWQAGRNGPAFRLPLLRGGVAHDFDRASMPNGQRRSLAKGWREQG
jgi:hypothetical protein